MIELLNTLFVTTPGTSLHLDGDAVRVIHPDIHGRRLIPLLRIDHMVVWNGVDVSNDLLHRCAADNRTVTWVTRNGRFLARATGGTRGNPHLRLAQYRTFDHPERRLALATAFVAGKLHNYRQLLLRAARDATGTRQQQLREIAARHATALNDLAEAKSLDQALGTEGAAARDYFRGLDLLAPGVSPGRSRRPPRDPINCVLSFGYGCCGSPYTEHWNKSASTPTSATSTASAPANPPSRSTSWKNSDH